MKSKIISVIYFLAGITYIFMGENSIMTARHIIKTCLIPMLILVFILNLRHNLKGINLLVLAGLAFSWAGDVAIDYSFIPGLVCFLIAHIMYLAAFFATPGKSIIFRERAYLLLPLVLYGFVLLYFLYDDLGVMKLPVINYALIILIMLASAIDRLKKVNTRSFFLVFAGAVLFVISDSALAVNKFTWHFDYSGIVIMSTYLVAQFLIVVGYIRQLKVRLE